MSAPRITDAASRAERRAPTPRVLIVGAGLGGIATAVNLVRRGIHSFEVFEKSAGAGGTWWDNRYPGAACDIPSMLYSYSFMLRAWPKTHANQAEIQQYVEDVIDAFDLRSRIRFDLGVASAVWRESRQTYDVTTSDGGHHEFDIVVSAVGMLNVPNEVNWPGIDAFGGDVVHSSRWPEGLNVTGRRVAVVGAGASAAQIVPELVLQAQHLVSFQREPAWITPKRDRTLSPQEYARLASSPRQRWAERRRILKGVDKALRVGTHVDSEPDRAARAASEAYIAEVLADRPDLRVRLMPDYPVRCKRTVQSNTFLQALTRENVTVARGVHSATSTGLVDEDGVEHDVDLVVLATGFQTTNYLATIKVVGRDGREIHDVWGADPAAFLGLTVPGFPNFYMLYGPNTHGTVVSFVLEKQAEYVAADVVRMIRSGATAIEVRPWAARWFEKRLSAGLSRVEAWKAGCHSYYHSSSGRNVTQWPWSHRRYALWTRLLRVPSSRLLHQGCSGAMGTFSDRRRTARELAR